MCLIESRSRAEAYLGSDEAAAAPTSSRSAKSVDVREMHTILLDNRIPHAYKCAISGVICWVFLPPSPQESLVLSDPVGSTPPAEVGGFPLMIWKGLGGVVRITTMGGKIGKRWGEPV